MSRIGGLVPANFRDKVCIRDNVPVNVKGMSRKRRLAVWSTLRSMLSKDLFALSQEILPDFRAMDCEGAVCIYGGVTCGASHTVLMVKERVLHILSVIDLQRLERSNNVRGCYIVDDMHESLGLMQRIRLRVTPFKEIIWSMEVLIRRASDVVELIKERTRVFLLDVALAMTKKAFYLRANVWKSH